MLYNIIVAPIEYIVGWIFMFIINKIPSLGVIGAICGVSVAVNILALPLYNIADSIQAKERDVNKKMERRVKRIKKGFRGDEEFMILSEYYRQNNYHPLYALRGSLSILIEIPFFIAAYNYLSSSSILKSASFWIFSSLGEADRLFEITLGSVTIPVNILPVIMTAINFVSGYIYTKDASKRDKIQLYALGLVFLVLLYNSPSGLVIYWILNNIFSLVKTIVLKTKHPGRFLHAFISLALIALTWKLRNRARSKFLLLAFLTFIFTLLPLFNALGGKWGIKERIEKFQKNTRSTKKYFPAILFSGLALSLLCGFVLPSSTIATSAEEFSYLGKIKNPTEYVWSTLFVFLGFFVFWPCCIYKMFGEKVRKWESAFLFTLLVTALLDAFVFKSDYGTLTTQFFLTDPAKLNTISRVYKLLPLLMGGAALLLYVLIDYYGKTTLVTLLCLSLSLGETGLGAAKMNAISRSFEKITPPFEGVQEEAQSADKIESVFHLSKNGKNVVVLFLDRALNYFLPYALNEIPELKEQLRGFTNFSNTVSFCGSTSIASPAMMGGYEYTPEKINERNKLLRDTHNEATLVAPILFRDGGYTVTVADAPFPNYSWRGDLSVIGSYDGIRAMELYGKYSVFYNTDFTETEEERSTVVKKEAVNFSMLEVLPPLFRNTFEFSMRTYRGVNNNEVFNEFVNAFAPLYFINSLTDFTAEGNTYTFIGNETTHNPVPLDSTLLKSATSNDRFQSNYPSNDESTYEHYSVFVAALRSIGEWLDWLRENECYDNTRIIIVSDHGVGVDSGEESITGYMLSFAPLFLYKDFNSNEELKYDTSFMTNADTIFLATEGLEEVSDTNPFTGEKLRKDKENGVDVYLGSGSEWNAPLLYDRNQFILEKNRGYHVKNGNTYSKENWTILSEWKEIEK